MSTQLINNQVLKAYSDSCNSNDFLYEKSKELKEKLDKLSRVDLSEIKKLALEIALQFTESRISLTEQAVQTADPDVSEETLNQIYNDYIIRIAYPIMDELTKKYIEELKQI